MTVSLEKAEQTKFDSPLDTEHLLNPFEINPNPPKPKFSLDSGANALLPPIQFEDKQIGRSGPVLPSDDYPKSKEEYAHRKADADIRFSMASTPQREALVESIDQNTYMSSAQKISMMKNLATFESRAFRDGISRQEVLDLYGHTSRILDCTAEHLTVTLKNRAVLAEQLVRNAAHPMSIDQGNHNTCNVSTVEARMYFKYPAEASKLLADIALTGQFETASGNTIKLDARSLLPDKEAQQNPADDGDRNYASQIFQLSSANIHWQSKSVDPVGNTIKQGDLRYVQIAPVKSDPTDTGERVRNFATDPEGITILNTDKKKILTPSICTTDLESISNEISGKSEKDFVLENKASSKESVDVPSELELDRLLRSAGNKMPLIVTVHTHNEPFYTESNEKKTNGKGGWHVVNIISYDPATKMCTMSNQWGSRSDHPISLKQLFKSMIEPLKQKKHARHTCTT